MPENFSFLFDLIKAEKIYIDKEEFVFQIQSHPSYPSLLAISDTLTFFNVENAALNISFEEIDLLPDNFIALLTEINDKPTLIKDLYCIKKENSEYFI